MNPKKLQALSPQLLPQLIGFQAVAAAWAVAGKQKTKMEVILCSTLNAL